ncbi:uncharacterized protein B0T23DRAFT_325195, partial [Neurospora hispaniola]
IAYITNKARNKVFAEYLTIKHTNFNTIASFFTYYILFCKRIKNTKFKINKDFKITFLYNTVKITYLINTKY